MWSTEKASARWSLALEITRCKEPVRKQQVRESIALTLGQLEQRDCAHTLQGSFIDGVMLTSETFVDLEKHLRDMKAPLKEEG
jgi:hypothetical protein